jgi:hypothetical protein
MKYVSYQKGRKMKKFLKTAGLILIVMIELAFFGCAMMPKMVTPAWIEPEAAEYADVNVPSTDILGIPIPYTNLYDAELVERKMKFKHLTNQLAGARLMEDDQLEFDYLAEIHSLRTQEARDLAESWFSATGPYGLLVTSLGIGGLCTYGGGKLIPRKREKELEAEVNRLNGGNHG